MQSTLQSRTPRMQALGVAPVADMPWHCSEVIEALAASLMAGWLPTAPAVSVVALSLRSPLPQQQAGHARHRSMQPHDRGQAFRAPQSWFEDLNVVLSHPREV